ncbi:uncharacterized protein HD556DRAFT_1435993 [Suillus plorans]|uniref:Uncharacterized protein n=1 Tax=Suillus plorans TaxID=116603 RepID=A0A9P7E445_9AGAM|nr:uncharacterized protein HD556DRAFT_1435993 [Suillus plorans]KAG1810282.1 hypothetical protein HD556DRAFT_1435993 [Suillus plorans]
MPAVRQHVCHSARLKVDTQTHLKAMNLPPPPIHLDPVEEGNLEDMDLHRTDARTLFYEGKKLAPSSNEEHPSGKDKGEIHRILAKLIFKTDSDYSAAYAEDPKKFDIVVGNHIVFLKKSFKEQLDKFNKTSAGVTPLDENIAINLHKQVLLEFLWYDQLHPFLFSNPTVSAKIFTSQLGVNYATDFYNLIHPYGGAGPSMNQEPQHPPTHPQFSPMQSQFPPNSQLLPPDPQLPPAQPQFPPAQPQLPLPSPHNISNHPPHYTGAEGNLIDDPDGDLYGDPYADEDELGPFSALLSNALDTLDGDVNMHDDDREFNSHHDFIILNTSPSPPPAKSNSFILSWKSQTPAYHSCMTFGSASPCSQAPGRLSSFISPVAMLRSHSSPASTISLLPYMSSDYYVLPMASQTSLSTKPWSSTSSKKKKTSMMDVEDHLGMLNNKISNIQSDMSEH